MAKGAAAKRPDWPVSNEAWLPIDKIRPNPRNSTEHTPEEVAELAAAIDEYGWTNRPLVDETGMLIAGEGRWLAAKLRGMPEVPVVVAKGWPEARKRAYVIWDNQSTKRSSWKEDVRDRELTELQAAGFDMKLTGFADAGNRQIEAADIPVREIMTSRVDDVFWIAIRGPLKHQAAALLAMRAALKSFDGVTVELGTIAVGE
jgi:ParB-like chromosome segregation protein Spo0J